MKIRHCARIAAPTEKIWRYIADPALWLGWNEQIIAVRRTRTGPVVTGEVFGATWRLKQQQIDTTITVLHVEPLQQLRLRQLVQKGTRPTQVDISFELKSRLGTATDLAQEVQYNHAGISFLFRLLMWFLHRFGQRVGPTGLERLKKIVEG